MAYKRKTKDVYTIQGFYCGEWSNECFEYTWKAARETIGEYRDNCRGTSFRIKVTREKL